MCPQGTQKSHSGAAACLVAYLCVHASHIALPACGKALDVPHIKHLTKKQREEWMIMDDQYFSFEALSRIYSVKDLLRL